MIYPREEYAEYNEVLASLIDEYGRIVIYPSNMEEWDILWKLMQQYKEYGDPIDNAQFWPSYKTYENHAVEFHTVRSRGKWPDVVSGWCSVEWLRSEKPYSEAEFLSFADAFSGNKRNQLTVDMFASMF